MRPICMKQILVLLAAVAVLGVACGDPAEPPAAGGPDTPVSNTPGSDGSEPGGPQRVEPSEGLVDIRATTFDRSARRDGGRALDLFFWSGIEECYGVDRVEVQYSKRTVAVTIFEGRHPEAETCIEIAVRKVIRVQLDEPLGDRTVVDGGADG